MNDKYDDFLNKLRAQDEEKEKKASEALLKLQQEEQKAIQFEREYRKLFANSLIPVLFGISGKLKDYFRLDIDQSLKEVNHKLSCEIKVYKGNDNLALTLNLSAYPKSQIISISAKSGNHMKISTIINHYNFALDEIAIKLEDTVITILNDFFI